MKPNTQIIEAILAADEQSREDWLSEKCVINTCYPCTSEAQCIDQLRALLAQVEEMRGDIAKMRGDLLSIQAYTIPAPGVSVSPRIANDLMMIELTAAQGIAIADKYVGG